MAFAAVVATPAALAAMSTRWRAVLLVPAAAMLMAMSVLSLAGALLPLLVPATLLWIAVATMWDGMPCGLPRGLGATAAVVVLGVAAVATLFLDQDPREVTWGAGGVATNDVVTTPESLGCLVLLGLALVLAWWCSTPRWLQRRVRGRRG